MRYSPLQSGINKKNKISLLTSIIVLLIKANLGSGGIFINFSETLQHSKIQLSYCKSFLTLPNINKSIEFIKVPRRNFLILDTCGKPLTYFIQNQYSCQYRELYILRSTSKKKLHMKRVGHSDI